MPSQAEKARTFRALHERGRAFLIPNPWDAGSARLLEHFGFEALATTSAGYAYSTGRPDHGVSRDQMLAHVTAIVAATDLPVSADLENGYGDTPESVAVTVRLAAAAGLAGCSIEDAAGNRIYGREHAADRIRAAVEAARALAFPFTLTARAENFITGRPDLPDTIRRLQTYQEAGADVLYAPGIPRIEDVAELVRSVDRPVNVLAPLPGNTWSLESLSQAGVRRISVGGALYRAAVGGFLRAVREMQEHGTFGFAGEAATSRDLAGMFQR